MLYLMHGKKDDEITYPLPNINGCTFESGYVILPHTLLSIVFLINAGIKAKQC